MKDSGTSLETKLDVAIGLLQHMLALELAREGVSQRVSRNTCVWRQLASTRC
jgi:hypothetical protein